MGAGEELDPPSRGGLGVRPAETGQHELIPHPPPKDAPPASAAHATGRARLFAILEPPAILARISSGDPLRLYELGARRVRERFFFVDQDRLYELVLAFVAHHAAVEKQHDPGDDWLRGIVDRAIDSILTEDAEEQRRMAAPNDPQDRRYYHLGLSVGVEPHVARSAVVNFNALPDRTRMGFFRLLIENKSVADTLAEGIWEPDELRHDIWDGLRALGHLREGEVIGKAARRRRKSK